MEQADVVRHAIDVLERLRIEYAIVGSFASIAYGEPRFTHDLDILVDLPAGKVADLCLEFPGPDWYASQSQAEQAVRARRPFNVIHATSGNKIDFIVSRDDAWNRAELGRRQRVGILEGLEGYAAHPEDVILGKLLYYNEGGSDKHLRDIAAMLSISGDLLEPGRIAEWAEKLGVSSLWQRVLDESRSE